MSTKAAIRLGHVERFVTDVKASRDFYVDRLGFRETVPMQGGVAWIDVGGVEVLLRPGAPPRRGTTYVEGGQALVLYTNDLTATRNAFAERGVAFHGTDGSPKCLTLRDPDGHWIQLVNPDDM